MGSRSQLEASLKDGRLTLEQIRDDYRRFRVEKSLPPARAVRLALRLNSAGQMATFKRYAYAGVDTKGKPLVRARQEVFAGIVAAFNEVDGEMLDDWAATAELMQVRDPYRYASIVHPDISAEAEDGSREAAGRQQVERVLVAIQSRLGEVARGMADDALDRASRETTKKRRREILATFADEVFQRAVGGDFFNC